MDIQKAIKIILEADEDIFANLKLIDNLSKTEEEIAKNLPPKPEEVSGNMKDIEKLYKAQTKVVYYKTLFLLVKMRQIDNVKEILKETDGDTASAMNKTELNNFLIDRFLDSMNERRKAAQDLRC